MIVKYNDSQYVEILKNMCDDNDGAYWTPHIFLGYLQITTSDVTIAANSSSSITYSYTLSGKEDIDLTDTTYYSYLIWCAASVNCIASGATLTVTGDHSVSISANLYNQSVSSHSCHATYLVLFRKSIKDYL